MTKITLLSDTHSYIDQKILNHCENADEIWHAGDIGDFKIIDQLSKIAKVRAVYGNIDSADIRKEIPLNQRFFCEEISVWITHIGGYPGKYTPNIKKEITENPPKLFISGHSHILKVINDKKLNLLHINPGAIGKIGFHKVRTLIKFEIDKKTIQNLQVVEFNL